MAFLAVYDSIVSVLALYVMFKWFRNKYVIRRIGMATIFVGCVYQALQSWYFVIAKDVPFYQMIYDKYPLWMLKDIGFGILLLGYIIEKYKAKNEFI